MDLGECLDILVSRVREALADPVAEASVFTLTNEIGMHLWEVTAMERRRTELLHAHTPTRLVRELSSLPLLYIEQAASHTREVPSHESVASRACQKALSPHPTQHISNVQDESSATSSVLLGRTAEIAMGILCNFVVDSRTAGQTCTGVLHILESAESLHYAWTSHAPLAAATLQCLAILCTAQVLLCNQLSKVSC